MSGIPETQQPDPTAAPARTGVRRLLWWLGWPLRTLLHLLLLGYKKFVSPVLPDSCRYHPSCSTYAVRAIERHGAVKGIVLASWRLLRCNPWSKGGWDPVPPRGRWVPPVYPDGRLRYPVAPQEVKTAEAAPPADSDHE